MVGRPREFDVDVALNAAMEAFWAKGYEATSLCDLMAATGLHKGSLYQAFGDKHSLFIQALRRYLDEMLRLENAALRNGETPLDGLRNVTHAIIDMVDADCGTPRGCMAVNAIVELAPHDSEVRKLMQKHVGLMLRSIEEAVVAAQEAGEISTERPPELIAAMIMTFVSGLATSIKAYINNAEAHALVDAQLEAIF